MIKIYSGREYESVIKQRKNSRIIFYVLLGLYIAAFATLFVFFRMEPAEHDSTVKLIKWITILLSALFFIFAYFFIGIRLSRIKHYCNFLSNVQRGMKVKNEGTFVRFSKEKKVKDKVDYYSMTLLEWSNKEQDYLERYVLLDTEKEFPPFQKGDKIYYITVSNVLCEWEINNPS